MSLNHLLLGQAGVYRVLAELLVREVNAYLPVVDVGVDILTLRGMRIQVKATRLRTQQAKALGMRGPAYFFSPSVKFRGSPERRKRRFTLRRFSSEVDFVVFWGVDEDRFWIVPATLADGLTGLLLRPGRTVATQLGSRTNAVYAHENRWDLLGAVPQAPVNEVPALHIAGESV